VGLLRGIGIKRRNRIREHVHDASNKRRVRLENKAFGRKPRNDQSDFDNGVKTPVNDTRLAVDR